MGQLLLDNNDARKHAEQLFEQLKGHPDACVSNLVTVLRQSQSVEHKCFAAVMLRKVLTRDSTMLWEKVSPPAQAVVKNELLNGLKEEQQKTVVRKICDTISELGAMLLDNNAWPELLPFMFTCVQSGQPALVESALNVFGSLAPYATEVFKPHLQTLQALLTSCLANPSAAIQVAALRAVAAFVQALDEPQDRDKFQPMLPAMLNTLGQVLREGDESSAQETLEMFIEVAEAHPRFLRKHLEEVVNAMLMIAQADQLEDATRQLAAEFLVTLCEARQKAPGMMRKLPQFVNKMFETLMIFLLDVEDDPKWHLADSAQHEDEGSGERFDFSQECLDRVAISLKGNALVPAAGQILPVWLSDSDWRKRHAALICLAQIAEGCAKVMVTQIEPLVDMCLKGLQDSVAKVRWAACHSLGQMCTDLGPDIQSSQHARVLPALLAVMDDFNNPRVQAHASAAVVNFSENCDADLLPPYLDTLITKLLMLLQHGKKLVQEGALTAMASVADCSQEMFVKYYDSVMPLLSNILLNANDKQHRMLRAKALECISLVGMAVGKDRFRGDAGRVMQILQQLQSQPLDNDDPTSSYMLQAGARLCKCLGQEFIPYMPIVMPSLLRSARLDPDVKVLEADDEEEEEEEDEDIERIPVGDKMITIRTSNLEEKATACSMLCCYVDELKEGFLPYVKEVAEIMVPLLKFWFHEEVRRAAVQTIPELLRSVVLAAEKNMGPTPQVVKEMLVAVWAPLMEALHKEPDTDVASAMLDSVSEIVELLEPAMLEEAMVSEAFTQFGHILKASEQRREERMKRKGTEDFDEEELEELEMENEQEEELFDQVGTCVGSFLKKFNDAVLPYVEQVMPLIAKLLDKGRGPEDHRIAVCVVDDLLEHSPAGRARFALQVLPLLLEYSTDKHSDLRQCSVYGLGVLAAKSPEMFKPYVGDTLQRLLMIVNHPEARSEDNEMASDNAVSALGKLLEFHSDVVDGAAVASSWVNYLPLTADAIEAQSQHEMLVKLMEAHDRRILGENNQHMPKLVSIMVVVLGRGTELIAGEVGLRMAALLHQLQHAGPGAELVPIEFAKLTPKQQATFGTYMSGQIPTEK